MRTVAGQTDARIIKILRSTYDDITDIFEVENIELKGDDSERNLKVVYVELDSINHNHLFVANDKQNDKTFIFEVDRKHSELKEEEHSAILKHLEIEDREEATLKEWFMSLKGMRFIGAYDKFFEIQPIYVPKKKKKRKKKK